MKTGLNWIHFNRFSSLLLLTMIRISVYINPILPSCLTSQPWMSVCLIHISARVNKVRGQGHSSPQCLPYASMTQERIQARKERNKETAKIKQTKISNKREKRASKNKQSSKWTKEINDKLNEHSFCVNLCSML